MSKVDYHKLHFLVADDFSSFRSTVNRMLIDMGASHVDMASNSQETIERCQHRRYDVVLCDYNLGAGRNGQHVLEELRYREYLGLKSIFVLVSAESSRNIVMSAYDCAPDDYLMKPITTKMLHTRLDRLLQTRLAMRPVYSALERGEQGEAMDILVDMSLADDRFSTVSQKLLGELFLKTGEYRKAEKLYMRVLEVRELDWARLGLARAKHLQGDLEQAEQWLEKIIEDNYLYLPAYDVLSDNCIKQGKTVRAQEIVQRSVEVSPMSILRQKNLAHIASDNNDMPTALEAMHKVVKLGKLSCYGSVDDSMILARTLATALEQQCDIPPGILKDTFHTVSAVDNSHESLTPATRPQLCYISARMHALKNDVAAARALLARGEEQSGDSIQIDVEVDHIRALIALRDQAQLTPLLERLRAHYEHDQAALEKLDEFLDEPASDCNKAVVAEVNREGIELYNEGRFDDALRCFDRVTQLFPKHLGLQLNIAQALIGKIKVNPQDSQSSEECRRILENVASNIDEDNAQYKRFTQLKHMARAVLTFAS